MAAVRQDKGMVYVEIRSARRLVTEIFKRAGCNDEEAFTIAMRLSDANLRGHDSHGIIRVPRYVEWIESGRVIPNQTIAVEKENEVIAIIDGQYGFGQTVGEKTIDIGVRKALTHGVSITALKNAGHLGRIGDWAERAASANCASIHMVNVRGGLLVAPFGGIDRRGSTSPFCCGVPLANAPPVILDFATSFVAEGKALVAARGGKPLPEGALIDGVGNLTTDPNALYGDLDEDRPPDARRGTGALTGFGLHKGSGLNFFMEMFAGALTGSGTLGALGESERRRFCNGMLSIYLSVDFFHSDDWFANEVRNYIDFWKSARPIAPGGEVLIPGEVEQHTLAERERTGLPLPEITWGDILTTANKLGLDEATVNSILLCDTG